MNMAELRPYLNLCAIVAALAAAGPSAAVDGIFAREMADGSVELSNVPDGDGYELLLATPKPAVPPAAARGDAAADILSPKAQPYRLMVDAAAKAAQVEPRLLHAVIAVESGYNPKAVSPKGAVGLMQLMPETARRYGATNARDPGQNLQAGAMYLRDLLHLFNNDLKLVLAAYNAGENAVIRYGSRIPPFPETTAYVPRVLAVYRKLEAPPL